MRLIDADKLKEEYRDDTNIGRMLKALVDIQPTSYDIDKVVEELDKESDYYECEEQGREHVQMVDLEKAIEIVKAGGRNDNR